MPLCCFVAYEDGFLLISFGFRFAIADAPFTQNRLRKNRRAEQLAKLAIATALLNLIAELISLVNSVKRRAEEGNYYNYFSSQKWGARGNYDLMISTSGKDIKQASVALAQYLKALLF